MTEPGWRLTDADIARLDTVAIGALNDRMDDVVAIAEERELRLAGVGLMTRVSTFIEHVRDVARTQGLTPEEREQCERLYEAMDELALQLILQEG